MRATVHLVTTEDALAWQGLTGPISARSVQSAFGKRLTGIDLDALASKALDLLSDSELSTPNSASGSPTISPATTRTPWRTALAGGSR